MDLEERIGILLITSFLTLSLVSLSRAQWEKSGITMNATISQPIGATLSNNLSRGIFFTNKTSIGLPQVPISNMTTEHNATDNYSGPSYNTTYWLTAGPGNTINVAAYMSICDYLRNATYGSIINLTYDSGDGGQGMFFKNSTTPSATDPSLTVSPDWGFPLPDNFRLIANNTAPGQSVFFRFWLDPHPNNAPSGIYNTTFKIRVVDYTQLPGDATC